MRQGRGGVAACPRENKQIGYSIFRDRMIIQHLDAVEIGCFCAHNSTASPIYNDQCCEAASAGVAQGREVFFNEIHLCIIRTYLGKDSCVF